MLSGVFKARTNFPGMLLTHLSWPEVENYLGFFNGIVIPIGSTEQHSTAGLIGTDALCAESIAWHASDRTDGMLVAPTICYTPAQFNLNFPGSISVRSTTLIALLEDIVQSLAYSGFRQIYFLNGHGANIAALRSFIHDWQQKSTLCNGDTLRFKIKSWWEFTQVNHLRQRLYGDREGMHATPSEISITQYTHRVVKHSEGPFIKLDTQFYQNHAGDNHSNSIEHRKQFPSGAVGSDPTLAKPEDGQALLELASQELISDYSQFIHTCSAG